MSHNTFKKVSLFVPMGLMAACSGQEVAAPSMEKVEVSIQQVRTGLGKSQGQSFLSLDVLATDDGRAISCDQGQIDVTVSVASSPEGPFEQIPNPGIEVRCTSDQAADVALVVDNSGSEDGYLPWLQDAARRMTDGLLPLGSRTSLVRVSTDSEILLGLTGDSALMHTAIDGLYIRNGWTALFDGIRMGNETLGGPALNTTEPSEDLEDFCSSDRKLAVVAFTDGRENNSSHQSFRSDEYPGDGLDTTLEDLYGLQVNNVTTPIYTVGLGENVDNSGLADLAAFTGGRHHSVATESDLPSVFEVIADYASSSLKFCTELPPDLCGDVYVKVDYRWSRAGDPSRAIEGSTVYEIHSDCPVERKANVATVLLTMSNPGIDREVAKSLAVNTVKWVSPVENPRILVVKDLNHHNEFANDAAYVRDLLLEAGLDVTFTDEPTGGLAVAGTDGYDVIWFSNPGYPIDDKRTLESLELFSNAGGGYVLQSDDATYVWGDNGYSVTSHTGLVHQGNGTSFCGRHIDNNATPDKYRVVINGETHPVIAGLENAEFLYGNDIDTSIPANAGEQVLAWASGVDASGNAFCDKRVPVVVVRTPAE